MGEPAFEIGEAEMQKMLGSAAHGGPWLIPLLVGLREGRIEIDFLQRDGKIQSFRPSSGDLHPMVLIIGDDDGDDRGPSGWPKSIQRTIDGSRFIMLNAAGGQAQDYELAMRYALVLGTALIIETASRHVEAWGKMLVGKPVIAILPRGGQHPLDMRETRH